MNFQTNSLRRPANSGVGTSAAVTDARNGTGDTSGWSGGRRSAGLRAGLIQTHVPKISREARSRSSQGHVCRCRAGLQQGRRQRLQQDILGLEQRDVETGPCTCSSRGAPTKAKTSASVVGCGDYVMEEYKLDDKELAALEKLYDFPARSNMANSSQVRAVSIIDTLSQMARTPEARRLAQQQQQQQQQQRLQQQQQQQQQHAQTQQQAAQPQQVRRPTPPQGKTPTKKVSTARPEAAEAAGSAAGAPSAAAEAPLDREAIIARLLAEAARSPPPPIPSRRPDLSVLNIRAEAANNNTSVRGKLPTPPSGAPPPPAREVAAKRQYRHRDDLLDDLYGRIKGRRPHEVRRTPDWIRTIFDVARRGSIAELRSSLAEMEPTLIRNLSDHHGNNLAHVLAACGHVDALAWLVDTCGHVLSEALADENKHGMTPSVAAVRCGKLDVVAVDGGEHCHQDRLFTREGERSLLHAAAKYGQVEIASWCADKLHEEGQGVDLADHHGDTPLHLAAKTGNTAVAQKLFERSANVTARNDMSLKPYDVALHHGHLACAEYLLTYEALAELAVDFTSLEAEAARLQNENADYKNNFREVLSVSRKLLREREDMCKDLSRLHESTLELHERLLGQLQQLSAENRQLRRRLQEPADEPPQQLDEAGELANTLHVRWQHCQRAWFSAPLADTQHRLLMAEQAWKRLRASRKDNVSSMTSAQEILRNKISDLRAQSAQTRYLESRALSSSETSLVDSELYQQISPLPKKPAVSEIYGAKSLDSGPKSLDYGSKSMDGSDLIGGGGRLNGRRPTSRGEVLDAGFLSEHEAGDMYGRQVSGSRRRPARAPRAPKERRGKSVEKMERLSVSVTGASSGTGSHSLAGGTSLSRKLDLSKSLDFSELSTATDEVHNSTFSGLPKGESGSGASGAPKRTPQEELRLQLRGLALVSDSGSASVLEVIEPTGSEAESTVDLVQREIEAQRRARQARSRDSSRSRAERRSGADAGSGAAKDLDQVRLRRTAPNDDDSDFLGLRTGKPHRSRLTSAGGLVVPTAAARASGGLGSDESIVRGGRAAAERSWRPEGGVGASLASVVLSEPDILQGTRRPLDRRGDDEMSTQSSRPPPEPTVPPPASDNEEAIGEDERPLFELDRSAASSDAGAAGAKRRGFLQKFAMRTRWNAKKKDRTWRPGQEISAEDFREMYAQEAREVSGGELSASEASSSMDEKKRLSLVSHGEATSPSEASDAEHRSKRASVASKRESDSNDTAETVVKEATGKQQSVCGAALVAAAAASGVEKRPAPTLPSVAPPPPPGLKSNLTVAPDTSNLEAAAAAAPKPKVAPKPSTLPRRLPAVVRTDSAPSSEPTAEEMPRPASSASRPESSQSGFPPYKGFALTASELMPAADSGAAGRHSPAPSEASKTESALSPPSHASDVSKTESTRHLNQLDKIEELRAESAQKLEELRAESAQLAAGAVETATAEAAAAAAKSPLEEPPPRVAPPMEPPPPAKAKRVLEKKSRRRRDERPWYEVSDDDSDMLPPARFQSMARSSSEEDAQII